MTDKLTEEDIEIVDAIKNFGETVKDLKQKRFRFTVTVSIAFGVVLALIFSIVLYILFGILPKVDENTQSVKHVQCSLYASVLKDGYHPEETIDVTDSFEKQLKDLKSYNFLYKTFVTDSNELGCIKIEEPSHYITDPSKATTTTLTTPAS